MSAHCLYVSPASCQFLFILYCAAAFSNSSIASSYLFELLKKEKDFSFFSPAFFSSSPFGSVRYGPAGAFGEVDSSSSLSSWAGLRAYGFDIAAAAVAEARGAEGGSTGSDVRYRRSPLSSRAALCSLCVMSSGGWCGCLFPAAGCCRSAQLSPPTPADPSPHAHPLWPTRRDGREEVKRKGEPKEGTVRGYACT